MNQLPNTDRLIPALRLGDRVAFETMCQEMTGLIRTSIFRYVKCEEDIQELVSETFLRAHKGLTTFRGECTLKTWLYKIAGNLAMNRYYYYKRRRKELTDSLDQPMGQSQEPRHTLIAADQEDARSPVETAELEETVRRNLPFLPFKQREILKIVMEEHPTYEEIAERLGIGLGTVKSRIARARENLRNFMDEEQRRYAA